ncbi:MAG: MFS transporter, partial [Deltaproteobacteria bacterium]|nr:MFS transporter [Deltaproteobacteria bacterium]
MATGVAGAVGAPVISQKFLGWRMVGIAAMAQFLGSAITLSPFGNFVLPVSETFGVAQGTVGLGIPIAILMMGLLGPFIGRMLDHGRARSLMSGGALVAGLGLILLAQTRTIGQAAWVFGGLVCAGTACFGMMSAMALVASWFVKRRGLALGLAVGGATIASYLAPVTAEYLIEETGWRTAVSAFGLLTLAVGVPILAWLTVGRPEDVGQLPDGEPAVESAGGDPLAGAVMLETRVLARDARLWLVAIGFGLILTSPIVLIGLLVPFGKTALGLTGQQANLFFAAMVPFSLLGKLAIGALADAIPPKPAICFVVIVNVIVWAIFLTGPSHALFV